MSHIAAVQDIYAAFGRQDVPYILSRLSENIEWEYGSGPTDVPWFQPRHGRGGAAAFFNSLAALDVQRLQPKSFFEAPGMVLVVLEFEATVKATGRKIVDIDEVHIWHFDGQGLVSRFAHRVDTLQHYRAYHDLAA